jgi:DNA-binding MurR/RpiR family transcriptional regulator
MADVPEAGDILAALAAKLDALGDNAGVLEPVDLAQRAKLLRIARDVAHATERQNAPLAAYLIGRFVQTCVEAGMTEPAAIDRAAEVVRSLIGEAPD